MERAEINGFERFLRLQSREVQDALFDMIKGIFGGFEAKKSDSSINVANSDSLAADPEPTSAKSDDPAPDS